MKTMLNRGLAGLLALACAATVAAGELKVGDLAVVNKDGAKIYQGRTVVATYNKGQRVKVYHVFKEGGFARIYYTIGGKSLPGDMRLVDLDAPSGQEEKEKPSAKNPFVTDDQVVVIVKDAKLKVGDNVVGTLDEGTRLKVQKVKDEWIGVTTDVKGKPTFGWLHRRDVDYPSLRDKEKSPPKDEPPPAK